MSSGKLGGRRLTEGRYWGVQRGGMGGGGWTVRSRTSVIVIGPRSLESLHCSKLVQIRAGSKNGH